MHYELMRVFRSERMKTVLETVFTATRNTFDYIHSNEEIPTYKYLVPIADSPAVPLSGANLKTNKKDACYSAFFVRFQVGFYNFDKSIEISNPKLEIHTKTDLNILLIIES
jgi:hypothetical protein